MKYPVAHLCLKVGASEIFSEMTPPELFAFISSHSPRDPDGNLSPEMCVNSERSEGLLDKTVEHNVGDLYRRMRVESPFVIDAVFTSERDMPKTFEEFEAPEICKAKKQAPKVVAKAASK